MGKALENHRRPPLRRDLVGDVKANEMGAVLLEAPVADAMNS